MGWKLGVTSRTKQAQVEVDSPVYGFLTAAGALDLGAPLDTAELIQPRAEPEVVFLLGAEGCLSLVADTFLHEGRWDELIMVGETHVDSPSLPDGERALLSSLLAQAFRRKGEFARAMQHAKRAVASDRPPKRGARTRTDGGRISSAMPPPLVVQSDQTATFSSAFLNAMRPGLGRWASSRRARYAPGGQPR